jgi:hypothetical protein
MIETEIQQINDIFLQYSYVDQSKPASIISHNEVCDQIIIM